MLELINFFSTLDDLLVVAGVILIGLGETMLGIALAFIGVAIMFGKGEILVPIK
ncbi:MAG: hypothetical protein ABIG96_05075 [Candidatus Micrarchaeota archaeon]